MRLLRSPKVSRASLRPALILVLLFATFPTAAGEFIQVEATLAWKFKRGDTLRYRVRRSVNLVVPREDTVQDISPAPVLDATLVWSVETVDADGTAEIGQTLERVREEMTERVAGVDRLVYDSGDPNAVNNNTWSAARATVYGPLIGARYRLKVDRRGRLVDVSLPEDALKGWQTVSVVPREDRDPLFTKNGVKLLLATVPELPGRPIRRGETWRNRQEFAREGRRITLAETYSLTDEEGPLATFKAKPELTILVGPNPIREPSKQTRVEKVSVLVAASIEKQSGESKLIFDRVAGRLIAFSRRHHYDTVYTFKGPDGTGPAESARLTTTAEFDMDLIRASSAP